MKAKKLKYQLMGMATMLCPIIFAGCTDWNDHYDGAGLESGSNTTLWQELSQNPQVSDFCSVLSQTKVFRQHKKTPVSYADLLSSGQSFTVIAPLNDTFDRDSLILLAQTAQGDSLVEKSFIQNHIARSLNSITPDAQSFRMLNTKHLKVEGNEIEGVRILSPNQHAKNGVLHVAERAMPFHRNLYELLCDDPNLNDVGSRLRTYEEDYFDADASVSSGVFEGVPIWIDSVIVSYNRMLSSVGYIDSEDSTYWTVAPTNAEWNRVWNEATQYFVYDAKVEKRDSIQNYWTTRSILEDAVFNMTDQTSVTDSLMSVPYLSYRRTRRAAKVPRHVFRQPFADGGILAKAQDVDCSNGKLWVVNEWPYTPMNTFFTELWTECEQTAMITDFKDCVYNSRSLVADSISDGGYLQIMPRTATSNWNLTFRINNTLSGTYDICAIVLPKSVENVDSAKAIMPCKFKAALTYVDENGSNKTESSSKTFQNRPLVVDTITLFEDFRFPTCNYDQDEIKVSLKLTCNVSNTPAELKKFNRELFLDCIYLRPKAAATNENEQ